jgi:hypothetical protein
VASAILAGATEQVHVHEKRAAADDLHEIAGPAGGAPSTTAIAGTPGPPAPSERGGALMAPVHEADDRRSRDKPSRSDRRRLHGRDHRPGAAPILGQRPRAGVRVQRARLTAEDGQRVDFLLLACAPPRILWRR